MAPQPAIDRRLQRLAAAFTPEWLAAQRWFRTKSRGVRSVSLADAAALDDQRGWLLVLAATDDAGREGRYLVPAVSDEDSFREPRDGEGVWLRIAGLMAAGAEVAAEHGRFVFRPHAGLAALLPGGAAAVAGLGERRLGVEQSNTSVAIGERLILKVYRLLEMGANPEIEVSSFLTDVRFGDAPSLAGSAEYAPDDGPPSSVSMLQELVESRGDGWGWALGLLAGGPPDQARAIAGIGRLGTLTRELHTALASSPSTPGFPSRAATVQELTTWRSRAEQQLDDALAATDGEPHQRLLAIAPRLRTHMDATKAGATRVTRIHGDYHLGQLLRTARGFKVIDFEGEPATPLAERREPASPLRDVAGMLRSIDYVAQVAHRESGLPDPEGWAKSASDAFLSSYGPISTADIGLLRAFEVEKACYEVRYEANMRPGWEWIPLSALERLAARQGN